MNAAGPSHGTALHRSITQDHPLLASAVTSNGAAAAASASVSAVGADGGPTDPRLLQAAILKPAAAAAPADDAELDPLSMMLMEEAKKNPAPIATTVCARWAEACSV